MQVLYQHSLLRQGQHVNYTLCAEHMQNMQVVQKGVYTLNCFLSVKETPQLEQGSAQDVVVCITAATIYHLSSSSSVHSR